MHIRQRYFRRIRLRKIIIESGISNHMGLMGFNHQNKLTLIDKSWKTHPEIFLKFSFSGSSHTQNDTYHFD